MTSLALWDFILQGVGAASFPSPLDPLENQGCLPAYPSSDGSTGPAVLLSHVPTGKLLAFPPRRGQGQLSSLLVKEKWGGSIFSSTAPSHGPPALAESRGRLNGAAGRPRYSRVTSDLSSPTPGWLSLQEARSAQSLPLLSHMSRGLPSPPKSLKPMIGLYKPGAFTETLSCLEKNALRAECNHLGCEQDRRGEAAVLPLTGRSRSGQDS